MAFKVEALLCAACGRAYAALMRRKLGLLRAEAVDGGDELLAAQLLQTMADTGADFTNVFR